MKRFNIEKGNNLDGISFANWGVPNDKLFPFRRVTTKKGYSCDLRQK
jgi:hypothetical protein